MESFDIGVVKREPLEEFHSDTTYFDNMMPYNNDAFESSVDWLSSFVDDRSSVQTLDQLTPLSDYSSLVLTSVNRDQTLNRLNEMNMTQRGGTSEDNQAQFNLYSPVSPEFDHRLEGGSHDLDCEMKSFYSGQQLGYGQGLNHNDNAMEYNNGTEKLQMQNREMGVKLEDDNARSSGDSDQGSESGYDSGAHSPNSDTPGTPPQCLMLGQVDHDRTSFSSVDVTPPGVQQNKRQPFFLSDEEKRTLISEGLPIPSGYPLTKSEERALKKVRRKIKNKISAQESRRKKKEYMETLEKRMEICSNENLEMRKKLESMDSNNRTLISQLQKLQAIVASRVSRPSCVNSTQTTNEASS